VSGRVARDGLRGAPDGAASGGPVAPMPPPTADPADKRICVARIGAAHGTTGEVRLWPFTADPKAVMSYGALTTADGRAIEIASLRPGKGFLIARIAGVTDRNGAERLRNLDLFISRDRLPPPAADEYYHVDLIGLAAQDRDGNALGTVIAVHNFGAGDLLEVAPARGETLLLPFTAEVAPEIDVAGGRIVLVPPAEIEADAEPRHERES
jgi:16S rRNA processing protein RimM